MSESATPTPEVIEPGQIKVWYIPQVGQVEPFEVAASDPETAFAVLEVIQAFSAFEFHNGIKPDYADAGGVARYETDGEGGHDWFEIEPEEIG